MDAIAYEWNLFKQTWRNRVSDKHIKEFREFDIFITNFDKVDISLVNKIRFLANQGTAKLSQDRKTLDLYKSPFYFKTGGKQSADIPVDYIFTSILDSLVNYITKQNKNIEIISF